MVRSAPHPDFSKVAPVSANYAGSSIAEAFNWNESVDGVDSGEWYLVAFRSVLRESADLIRLFDHDHRAFDEAARAPGFVHYFMGPVNDRREALSFCIWESREQARTAARGPEHLAAIELIHEMYESYSLEFLRLKKRLGASLFEFEPYDRVGVA